MKIRALEPRFVEHLPEKLEDGLLYISEPFALAAHKCCCGCGEEVITPLRPSRWRIIKGQRGVSLWPSIGNWKFPCRSHYWIRDNQVIPAPSMSLQKIEQVKRRDRRDADRHIQTINRQAPTWQTSPAAKESWLARAWYWLRTR
ncbi:DUF6527 family protein [Dyella jiangningensis]